MDNNNQVPQGASAQTTAAPTQAPAEKNASTTPESGNKNMILMLVVGVILILGLVGGIYYYLSMKQTATTSKQPETNIVKQAPAPIAQIKDALDKELDAIDVSASEGDFKSVDQDLQAL